MSDAELFSRVAAALDPPPEMHQWLIDNRKAIEPEVVLVARVNGIEQAVKDVKELFLADLQNHGIL